MAAPIVISILANSRGAVTGIASVRGHLSKLVGGAALAGGGMALLGKASVKSASDAQQSIGATETVFAKSSDKIIAKSKKASKQYGLSANVYRENANLIGSLLKNQGVAQDQLAGKTDKMIGTASDLAATFGGTTTDAVGALSSALKGEFDPLERYGISLKQSTVNAEAMKVAHVNGAAAFGKLTTKQQTAAKQQATNNLIMKQSKDSMGAFGRETNTFAHQTQVLSAQWDNFKATLGTYLLPVLTKTVAYISTNAPAALAFLKDKLGPVITTVREFFNGLSSGGGQAGAILVQFRATATEALTNVQSIFASVVAIVTVLWSKFGSDLVAFARASLANIMTIVRGALNIIAGIFKVVSSVLKGDWKGAWEGVKQIARGALQVVQGIVRQGINIVVSVVKMTKTALVSAATGAFNGIKDGAQAGWAATKGYVKGIPGKITGAIGDLGDLLKAAGRQVIDGLIGGIGEKVGDLKDKVNSIAGDIKGAFKGAMSIFSPSRVMRVLGRYVTQGVELGILDGQGGIRSAVLSLANIINDDLPKKIKKPKAIRAWYREHKQAIADGSREVLSALKASAAERLAALKAQRAEYAAAVSDAAKQYAGLGNLQLGENENLTGSRIVQYFNDRLSAVNNFNAKLASIKNRVTSGVYDQIVQMGVEQGTAYADALSGSSPEVLGQINTLSTQINTASAALGASTAATMYTAGVNSAQGYYDGLQSMLKKIEKQGVKLAKALVKELRKALDINSPSRVMRGIGKYSVDGLDQGLDPRRIQDKGRDLAKSLVKGYANPQLDAQLTAGFSNSADIKPATKDGDTYNITVRLDSSMTREQMGVEYHKAIEAAKSIGLVRSDG